MRGPWQETAVANTVSGIMMTAVVGMAVALIGVALLSSPVPLRTPSFDIAVSNTTSTILLTHNGGDTLLKGEYAIMVDGADRTSSFIKITGPAGDWAVGETLRYGFESGQKPRRILVVSTRPGNSDVIRDIHL